MFNKVLKLKTTSFHPKQEQIKNDLFIKPNNLSDNFKNDLFTKIDNLFFDNSSLLLSDLFITAEEIKSNGHNHLNLLKEKKLY
ncbi:MAG: hypothetical protein Q8889_01435 [Candidatus Phytoplasma australasiaticum]|nr:hypothetical protein [Candidatus Phytoplasma australasiaticum]MDV3199772.1 hypothetical protein [Candidatus Phytoplasma australasiaticum]